MLLRRVSFAFVLLVAFQFAHAQNQPGLLQKRQKELRDQSEQTTRGIQELPGTYKLRDVLQVRAVNGVWALSSSLPATQRNQPVRLKVDGLEGVNVLTISGVGKNKRPDEFTFTNTNFSDPRAMQVAIHLTLKYGMLNMGRYAQLLDGYHNVTLNQGNIFEDDFGRQAGGRTAVQFSVQIGDSQGTSQTNIQYIAPDFASLRRQHPKEIDQYLRPVLRQLQMESVLAADPMIAWQVFADDLKPDQQTLKDLQAILPALDSDSFQDRDGALQTLQQKGLPVAVAISHLDRSKLSDQQNMMLDTAMAAFQPQRNSDLSRLRSDLDFLLDCLYTEDLAIRAAAHEALQKKLGRVVKFDLEADFATRSAAIDAMRSGDAR
ncbi:MAG TPA: hypothetical protein VGQ99_07930 [Tepidisphaeraceae bacterium]|jgi:hypothetical protein|nr:hypothetical protein [Tepidisphaeraceae bacterium]